MLHAWKSFDPLQQYFSLVPSIGAFHKQASLLLPIWQRLFQRCSKQLLSALQGLKMTDGLYSMTVCNDSMVQAQGSYPYRSYELLIVHVSY